VLSAILPVVAGAPKSAACGEVWEVASEHLIISRPLGPHPLHPSQPHHSQPASGSFTALVYRRDACCTGRRDRITAAVTEPQAPVSGSTIDS